MSSLINLLLLSVKFFRKTTEKNMFQWLIQKSYASDKLTCE